MHFCMWHMLFYHAYDYFSVPTNANYGRRRMTVRNICIFYFYGHWWEIQRADTFRCFSQHTAGAVNLHFIAFKLLLHSHRLVWSKSQFWYRQKPTDTVHYVYYTFKWSCKIKERCFCHVTFFNFRNYVMGGFLTLD